MFPWIGRHRVTGTPVKLSDTPPRLGATAPGLGEHSAEVLAEVLGMNARAIDDLRRAGVISDGQ
jgi:CoA:oxalate CoA-transferase